MNLSDPKNAAAAAQSVVHWWQLAGVDWDYEGFDATQLGKPAGANKVQDIETAPDNAPIKAAIPAKPHQEKKSLPAENFEFPDEYAAFIEFLNQRKLQPESQWHGDIVLPHGDLEPKLMMISAMPDSATHQKHDTAAQNLFSKEAGQLLENIIKACGLSPDQCYFSSLALSHVADRQIFEDSAALLKPRMNHLISLVKPRSIVVLGNGAAQHLLEKDLLSARGNKQNINHVISKVETIATFHPRVLLNRPELKAACWDDMRRIIGL